MAKRRVYEPARDEGWSNGKYWSPKRRYGEDKDDGLYDSYCEACRQIAPHQWDECVVCNLNEKTVPTKAPERREDLDAFGRDLADI